MELLYLIRKIFIFHLLPTHLPSHLYPLQLEKCDSNSWLVLDGDDNSKFRFLKGGLGYYDWVM